MLAPGSVAAAQLPRTQFVGRSELLDQVGELVLAGPLVTLVGPGGIGKTRVAIELSRSLASEFPDGAVVVTLDSVQDPADVGWRTAALLNASDQSRRSATDHVVRHLSGKRLLLVLDNCEHVLDAAADLVVAILAHCPGVHVLATSLGPLGLSPEQVVSVPPLDIPDPRAPLSEILASDAVGLLVQRTAQAGVPLAVTEQNAPDVVELCRHLDGMPLAIELAAVRLRSLTVGDVLHRLDERFSLLRGGRDALPRHQTLSALVDWSFDLCTPDEQVLWRRLAVFGDGCDLGAAETVCGDERLARHDILDLLDNLVAKSIVQAQPVAGCMRYRMLVTIREYGARVAQLAGEWDELRRRHRDLYLTRAQEMVRVWPGPRQAETMAVMALERSNIVAALDWSLSVPGERARGAELAALLRYQWVSGRYLSDGRYRLDRVLDAPEVTGRVRGEALWVATWVNLIQGDHVGGEARLAELQALAERLDDRALRAQADHWGGLSLLFHGRPSEGAELYAAAIATFRAIGDVAAWQTALFQRGLCQIYAGDPAGALVSQDELVGLSEANGERWCRAYACWVRGLALFHTGDLQAARASALAALDIERDFGDAICIAHTLLLLSSIAVAAGDYARAARLQGGADSLWEAMGTHIGAFGPGLAGDAGRARSAARRALGVEDFDHQRGSVQPRDTLDALEWGRREGAALEICQVDRSREPLPGVRLTAREAEVARLLARGGTNKQIAAALTISPRTAEGHVDRLLKKLGVGTRAQATALLLRGQSEEPDAHIQPNEPSGSSTSR